MIDISRFEAGRPPSGAGHNQTATEIASGLERIARDRSLQTGRSKEEEFTRALDADPSIYDEYIRAQRREAARRALGV